MKFNSMVPVIIGAASVVALVSASVFHFMPHVVWNGSASAPEGLYFVRSKPIAPGDYVLVDPPQKIKIFIETRGYLPPDTPLIKRIAALSGAKICRQDKRIMIDNVIVAYALREDSMGRPMPVWSGCNTLQSDEIFLLNDHEKSLDGRYFGALSAENIIGVATPIWTFSSDDRLSE